MQKLNRILILNRAEIAERIARTCLKMGLEPIIVYSDADRDTLAVKNAKEAYRLGAAALSDSYMNVEKVLALAKQVNADALHPGYGLLSESSDFAKQVEAAGLTWIGPSPQSMDQLSSKSQAKQMAEQVGVPLLPSFYAKDKQDLSVFRTEAERIGFPVLLKAAAGGGGRGIRLVEKVQELEAQFSIASSEALSSFGSAELLLEKYLPDAHHIEIQVFGDQSGEVVHLGERDCSAQRRHQKIIEESPSPALSPDVRNRIANDAVKLAKACRYTNAGTVEFLLSPSGEYYFLEVNTRLQVEHPVTEMVTGLDLVEWQLKIAQGEKLPLKQSEIKFSGHSIQARIYAEDPYKSFQPQMGRIEAFEFSKTIRVDHFLTDRTEVSSYYDSMLAKLIAFAPSRDEAIQSLSRALEETFIVGLTTNQVFLKQILESDFFKGGKTFTRTLDQVKFTAPELKYEEQSQFSAALSIYLLSRDKLKTVSNSVSNWTNNLNHRATVLLKQKNNPCVFYVNELQDNVFEISRSSAENNLGKKLRLQEYSLNGTVQKLSFYLADESLTARVAMAGSNIFVLFEGELHQFVNPLLQRSSVDGDSSGNSLTAPLEGTVVKLLATPGQKVSSGELLVVIEAMKMQFELRSPFSATVESVDIKTGAQVKNRQLLLKFKSEATTQA